MSNRPCRNSQSEINNCQSTSREQSLKVTSAKHPTTLQNDQEAVHILPSDEVSKILIETLASMAAKG